jgi:hypothetical protein
MQTSTKENFALAGAIAVSFQRILTTVKRLLLAPCSKSGRLLAGSLRGRNRPMRSQVITRQPVNEAKSRGVLGMSYEALGLGVAKVWDYRR